MRQTFRSLGERNYRVWAIGTLVSNVGGWMQRVAQDWLVLTELTDNSASAVGIVTALQFLPPLLLLPWTGMVADRFDQRKILVITQIIMAFLAISLGVLTITGLVELWHVYILSLTLGCAAAFDAPVRQAFVSELVDRPNLANAVALNATSFNSARMIGPALAGFAIAAFGTGWAFIVNGITFIALLGAIALLRQDEMYPSARASRASSGLMMAMRYVWDRKDLRAMLIMLFIFGTFGMNFAIWISTMAVSVFHSDAHGFGLLGSVMAIGTVAGALLAANRAHTRFGHLIVGTTIFGVGCLLASVSPSFWFFGASLALIGIASVTFLNGSNQLMQLTVEPEIRGRVLALRMAVALGGTPIGSPIIGWVADQFGPRWSMGIGVLAGLVATAIGLNYWLRHRHEDPSASPAE